MFTTVGKGRPVFGYFVHHGAAISSPVITRDKQDCEVSTADRSAVVPAPKKRPANRPQSGAPSAKKKKKAANKKKSTSQNSQKPKSNQAGRNKGTGKKSEGKKTRRKTALKRPRESLPDLF